MVSTALAAVLIALLSGVPSAGALASQAPDRYPRQVVVIDVGQDTEVWQGWSEGEKFTWLDLKEAGVEIGDVLDVVWEPGQCTGDGWCPHWTMDVGDFRHNEQPDLSFVLPYGDGFPRFDEPMVNQAHPWLLDEPARKATRHEVPSQVWASDTVIRGWRRVAVGFYDGWMWDADLVNDDGRLDDYEGERLAADESGDSEVDEPGDEPEADERGAEPVPADGADPAAAERGLTGRLWEAWLALAALAAVMVAVVTRAKRRREDGDEPEPSDE
ncbi:hypothetical protein [Microbacterium sp.]|uniref:hypothetical protein n=1 Tax=Microbacterium sp. TaxID=51671 RepID=UPI002732606D|nr:hypothetical protein [Microbacterium sp.]MDP3953187.1 hypothetical protein [Microbacterium sp.]